MAAASTTLLGYPVDVLTFFAHATAALVIALGSIAAIIQLREIRKQQYFESYTQFLKNLQDNEGDRRKLFTEFKRRQDFSKASYEDIECARQVMNFLNRTAILIYEGRLPCRIVFRIFHTGIIRCWYQLELFSAYEEKRLKGGRYGRLVKGLAERAKRFHDVRPLQRVNPVYVYDAAFRKKLVYRTRVKSGFAGFCQRVLWRIKWICRIY